jgi:hypothetical protein
VLIGIRKVIIGPVRRKINSAFYLLSDTGHKKWPYGIRPCVYLITYEIMKE